MAYMECLGYSEHEARGPSRSVNLPHDIVSTYLMTVPWTWMTKMMPFLLMESFCQRPVVIACLLDWLEGTSTVGEVED